MEKRAAAAKVAKDIAEHTQEAAAAQKAVDEAAEKLEVEKQLAAERQRQLERKQVRTLCRRTHNTQTHTHTHTHTQTHMHTQPQTAVTRLGLRCSNRSVPTLP